MKAAQAALWVCVSLAAAGAAAQQTAGSPAIDAAQQAARAAAAAQQKIDQLDDASRALLERYRAALWQTQQLRVYVQQIQPLLATQDAERAQLQQQLQEFGTGSHDLLPLMLRMLDGLEKFVALDLPFLQDERRERLESLKRLMADPSTPQAEKLRRVLEAYRVEADYGRTLGSERMQIEVEGTQRTVDVLRLGRVALYYLTLDGADAGVWDAQSRRWRPLSGRYRHDLSEGLKIAHEVAAPVILTLPVPVPAAATKAAMRQRRAPAYVALGAELLARLVPDARAAEAPVVPAQGMEALLAQIRQAAQQDERIDAERIQRFVQERDQQQARLAQAQAELKSAQTQADGVRARYEANEKAIAELKNQLQSATGELGQAYAAVRDAAARFKTDAADSYLTAQFPERMKLLTQLSAPDSLPSPAQLEQFWLLLMQELAEDGKVARFSAPVTGTDGQTSTQAVTRVGPFVAFAGGRYLLMQPGGGLQVAERQTLDRRLASDFEAAQPGSWKPIPLDPTRGNLIRLESQRPTLWERIEQGRLVGYVIIAVGLVGAALALFQLYYLLVVGRRMARQLREIDRPRPDNPLGRVLACLDNDAAEHDVEVLETRISEAVLRETPKLERFQPFLRMVVAAGPLLGLLGTVTGMIVTFQVITELGAGDPKVMAGGISQAMVSTVLGLLIAIPILFINSVLAARSRVLVQILDEQSAGLLARRLEEQHRAR